MPRLETAFATPVTREAAIRLGAAIRQARLARRMSTAECAERARISRATLVRIESGDVAVRLGAWLSALEVCNLLHLLATVSNPDQDALGRVERQREARKRTRATKAKPEYDF
ncbi:MAG TPA: helix-turn-helix transcriptional regulator [Casimicrobiaceae bacterium]|jgi:transcriptional regulator with XRE-family HTH domain|nr:helix-turn-helix transcriptional regulator [Casimicrobiaceae bacterium]